MLVVVFEFFQAYIAFECKILTACSAEELQKYPGQVHFYNFLCVNIYTSLVVRVLLQ